MTLAAYLELNSVSVRVTSSLLSTRVFDWVSKTAGSPLILRIYLGSVRPFGRLKPMRYIAFLTTTGTASIFLIRAFFEMLNT